MLLSRDQEYLHWQEASNYHLKNKYNNCTFVHLWYHEYHKLELLKNVSFSSVV